MKSHFIWALESKFIVEIGIKAQLMCLQKGFGMHNNPYFNNHATWWHKESFFIIKAEELDLDVIVNTSVFILPFSNRYKVGATYTLIKKLIYPPGG
jgi:hypothetical protein